MDSPDPGRFDWHLVRSFLAVLDAGSLTAAARATQAHQPTLSRHVAELEAQLGAPLFERTGRGVEPTALARSIADAARQMQDGAEQLSRALARAWVLRGWERRSGVRLAHPRAMAFAAERERSPLGRWLRRRVGAAPSARDSP
jgi:DNA-binding transcriptional LysR family regulator